jgi:pSer/pThr/pTyr-binding forkhead associated (FHA) protein
MWILRASATDGSLTFRLATGAARTMGRAPTADFVVDVALVSRMHCRLVAGDDGLDVEDLSSTNGTYINGQRIDHGKAAGGDRLRIGRVELMVERSGSAGAGG